jgi:hypothetical protein
VTADGYGWSVRATPSGVVLDPADPSAPARVEGDPESVLLWLWGRAGDDRVSISGDRDLVAGLRRLLHDATQ